MNIYRPLEYNRTITFHSNNTANNFGQFGQSVSSLHDVNGDGAVDVLIGADDSVYVLFAPSARQFRRMREHQHKLALDVDHNLVKTFRIHVGNHTDRWGNFGENVALIGDFNGDGYADFVIGAPQFTADPTRGKFQPTGAVLVVFGQANLINLAQLNIEMLFNLLDARQNASTDQGPSIYENIDLDPHEMPSILMIVGEHVDDLLGASISATGDLNNDGLDDFVMLAPMADGIGRAYVVFGFDPQIMHCAHFTNTAYAYRSSPPPIHAIFRINTSLILPLHPIDTRLPEDPAVQCLKHRARLFNQHILVIEGASTYLDQHGPKVDVAKPYMVEEGEGFENLEDIFCNPDYVDVAFGNVGSAAAGGGDHNGDGYLDLAFGNSFLNKYWTNIDNENMTCIISRVNVVFGPFRPSPTPDNATVAVPWLFLSDLGTPDLTPGYIFVSLHSGPIGRVLRIDGDIDGDGYDDVLFSADGNRAAKTNPSRLFVSFGNDFSGVQMRKPPVFKEYTHQMIPNPHPTYVRPSAVHTQKPLHHRTTRNQTIGRIISTQPNQMLIGTDGNDLIQLSHSNTAVRSGAGNDTMLFGSVQALLTFRMIHAGNGYNTIVFPPIAQTDYQLSWTTLRRLFNVQAWNLLSSNVTVRCQYADFDDRVLTQGEKVANFEKTLRFIAPTKGASMRHLQIIGVGTLFFDARTCGDGGSHLLLIDKDETLQAPSIVSFPATKLMRWHVAPNIQIVFE
eukprot:CAMPEP_0201551166 /NCGR_PEP_ID=MMETSP0173_2-20130828/7392_1 /ASSEMBLY_ACC=CAM_ASM_000268 /TAXON_ID=218659 /ORGANISM="Vexillifera sp., Strain DIVA3 564/2" /LENGTH=733 /DNA_ID=CAMNT_0047961355 /DNA_START=125 /DNA_END=2326 /DNA_ORIENTATION=-